MSSMTVPRPEKPLDAAIKYFGSSAKLAQAIGYTSAAITNWKTRGYIPPYAAVSIEMATQGQIKREELCPGEFTDTIQ